MPNLPGSTPGAHAQGQQHPLGIYFKIWGLLFVLSAASYMVDYFHFQGLLRWTLIVVFMLLKAGLIVSVFMHMLWERLALVYAILVPPLLLMVLMGIGALEADYTFLTRGTFFAPGDRAARAGLLPIRRSTMHRRVYWLLPDLTSARATMDDLLLAGVELRQMHFVAREDCDMSDLHAANVLQTSDVIPSAGVGMIHGAALGGMLGAFAAAGYPVVDEGLQWDLVPLLVVVGALFDAWTSSMIGISAPNRRLRRFAPQIEQGRILLAVDVPIGRVAEIEARLQALHPEVRLQGSEPGTLSFL